MRCRRKVELRLKQLYFKADDAWESERLDKYLAKQCEDLSRSYIQKLLKEGHVLVNGLPAKSSYRLTAQDEISFLVPDAIVPEILPEDIPLDIVYEDQDVILVNKPKGMVVHPAAGHYSGTLVNGLMYHCRDSLSGINGVMRPGIVHRIDKDTSGLLIVCKNDQAHACIAEQLKVHSITRRYQAIVHGRFQEETGTINAPVGRNPHDRMKMAVNRTNGKEAVTHYKVLRQWERYALVECRLETGRTHQIRVHMSYRNHPLLGDYVYGPDPNPVKCKGITLSGQALHAQVFGFVHPSSKKYMEFEAPLPEYFAAAAERLGAASGEG